MPDDRPNIVLFMTDQQRGDCLGIDGHPVLQTPYLDQVGATGVRFTKAYSACPICVAARRTLMTGQKPVSHGVFSNYHTRLDGPTLPGELSGAGYQTHLVGKLHLWPIRKLYGFDSADWSDSPHELNHPVRDDYDRFLDNAGLTGPAPAMAHGCNWNGWASRPYHMDERFHFTNWCADRALEFLDRRDPTVPFFLKVSFHQPHQPCSPPQTYWDRYMNMDLPDPVVGDWSRVFDVPQRGLPVAAWRACLEPAVLKQYQAGYYGCINHIDDQIGRVLSRLPRNTIIVFTSDHGEMLGDHQWIRKRNAFEGSARIPMLMQFPASLNVPAGQVRSDEVVELMDIMPTLLEAAGVPIPDTVDGTSVLPMLRSEHQEWREYLHGENSQVPTMGSGMQYLTDGKRKYIWYPGTGDEYFFNLEEDPSELHNLAGSNETEDEIQTWRNRLVAELAGRPEGFTRDGSLKPIGGDSPPCLQEYRK